LTLEAMQPTPTARAAQPAQRLRPQELSLCFV
jgi:hypothetical protein